MTKTKILQIYGYLMIFFGVLDLVYLAMDASEVNSLLGNYSEAVAIFTYVFFGLCVLITLAKFWMGRQALRYAKGVGKGTSHILLAKIGIAFGVLAVASDVVKLIGSSGDISEVASSCTSLAVMIGYYQAAKDYL